MYKLSEQSVAIAREALRRQAELASSLEAVGFVLFSPDEYSRFRAADRAAIASGPKGSARPVSEL